MTGVQAAQSAYLFSVAVPSSCAVGAGFAAADPKLSSRGDPRAAHPVGAAWRVRTAWLGLGPLRLLHRSRSYTERACTV